MTPLPTVICLMGPTASGKTALAIELAQQLPCEIISVDSAMVYRGMDIGTAKPTPAERAKAPHRLLDILDPAEPYSAGQFCNDALREIAEITAQGRIPLLVGGTMLYFRALQQGLSNLPSADKIVRERLALQAAASGWPEMHQYLEQFDPEAARRISPNDSQRIARALEVLELTGRPYSEVCAETKPGSPAYHFINIGLIPEDRSWLHARIEQRFKAMLQAGFIEEVAELRRQEGLHADLPSMRAVGYRQVWAYLAGELPRLEMEKNGIIATNGLAKRQLTWLRSWPDLSVISCEDKSPVMKFVELWKSRSDQLLNVTLS